MQRSEKIAVWIEQLSPCIGRKRNFQIKTTVILSLSLSVVVFTLGVVVNNNARRFLHSDEDDNYFRDGIEPKEKLLRHSMSDKELFRRASMAPGIGEYPYKRKPKVAFMFLTRGRLPLAPLWERFFKGHGGKEGSLII